MELILKTHNIIVDSWKLIMDSHNRIRQAKRLIETNRSRSAALRSEGI